jgi:hypothetical protein
MELPGMFIVHLIGSSDEDNEFKVFKFYTDDDELCEGENQRGCRTCLRL